MKGRLERATMRSARRRNAVILDDGRELDVIASTVLDVCPACGMTGAPVGVLEDGSVFHNLPSCDVVSPPSS